MVESKHTIVRVISTRLLQEADYFAAMRNMEFTFAETLSRSKFPSNVMYGGKKLSSFEIAGGYTPGIMWLLQSQISEEVFPAYLEQTVRCAIQTPSASRNPRLPSANHFKEDMPVYYFKRGPKFGSWHVAFVRKVQDHSLLLSSNERHCDLYIRVAYEDVRLVPKSALFVELDQMELISPLSYSVLDKESEPLDSPGSQFSKNNRQEQTSSQDHDQPQQGSIDFLLNEEVAFWSQHPILSAFLAKEKVQVVINPSTDIGSTSDPPRPEKNIGSTIVSPVNTPQRLNSAEQEIIRKARIVLGVEHVPEFCLQFFPRWIVDNAITKEKNVYDGCYSRCPRSSLPKDANIVGSHHLFHIEDDGEKGQLRLKRRLVSHGNQDKDTKMVQKDSSSAQFPIIPSVLSLAAILSFPLATIDITGAYLQGGSLNRDIYMIPPRSWERRGVVWKILVPTYGHVESGRLWQLTIEKWLFSCGFEAVHGLPQLFVLHSDHKIQLALAKVVDDLIIAGHTVHIRNLHNRLAQRFNVGKFELAADLLFNQLRNHRHSNGSIRAYMRDYMAFNSPLDVSCQRRKQFQSPCSPQEKNAFLGLTGALNFLGHGVLPQAAFVASNLQQRIGSLEVLDLLLANASLREIQGLTPEIVYLSPEPLDLQPRYLAFSNASQGKGSYGQTGYLSGLYLPAGEALETVEAIYHLLDWSSSKQERVTFSAIGAEILAAAVSADRGSHLASCIKYMYGTKASLPFVLTVDSDGLHSTITTLHEGRDYRLRPTVSRVRDSFKAGEIDVLLWIPSSQNLADALTKHNIVMFRKLNSVMLSGFLGLETLRNAKRTSQVL